MMSAGGTRQLDAVIQLADAQRWRSEVGKSSVRLLAQVNLDHGILVRLVRRRALFARRFGFGIASLQVAFAPRGHILGLGRHNLGGLTHALNPLAPCQFVVCRKQLRKLVACKARPAGGCRIRL